MFFHQDWQEQWCGQEENRPAAGCHRLHAIAAEPGLLPERFPMAHMRV
ncbi:hypothetical protein ACUXV3_08000 [Roseobacteraceae bacterium NS-SX3]